MPEVIDPLNPFAPAVAVTVSPVVVVRSIRSPGRTPVGSPPSIVSVGPPVAGGVTTNVSAAEPPVMVTAVAPVRLTAWPVVPPPVTCTEVPVTVTVAAVLPPTARLMVGNPLTVAPAVVFPVSLTPLRSSVAPAPVPVRVSPVPVFASTWTLLRFSEATFVATIPSVAPVTRRSRRVTPRR